MDVLLIQRAERFSPNAIDKDYAILDAVGEHLHRRGVGVKHIKEESLTSIPESAALHMCRSRRALQFLRESGQQVINVPSAVEICNSRHQIDAIMRLHGISCAPLEGSDGYWVKSDCGHDMAFCSTREESHAVGKRMKAPLVTAHVVGERVKFYGVNHSFFYPVGYPLLRKEAQRLAALIGVDVWGGDAIIRSDGTWAIIDFNDWPSFSVCRDEAAYAIVEHALTMLGKKPRFHRDYL